MKKRLDINSQEYRDIVEKLLNKKVFSIFNIYKDSRRVDTYYIGESPILKEDTILYANVNKPEILNQVYYGLIDSDKVYLNNMEEFKRMKTDTTTSIHVYERSIVESFYL